MDRRNFISTSVLTTAGIGLAGFMPEEKRKTSVSPSDVINVALVGCNSMGFGILQHHLSNTGVNCVAMCDIDQNVLRERAATIKKDFGQAPELYGDFRKLLDQKDIDAVIVGTPDHWHCLITCYALQAGKDVYVEKPMANSIGECNTMVKAAKYYNNRIIQVGQQQRSGFIFRQAMEFIKGGKIGKLRRVNIWANFNYGAGSPLTPDEPVPSGVDFDMWLGPAPKRTFNKTRFHGMWRMFWDYGGGLMSDWGVHLLDIGIWAGDVVTPPEKVLVYGANTFHEARSRETFDSMTVTYPRKDYVINWDMTAGIEKGPYDSPYGLVFIGDDATMFVNRNKLTVWPEYDSENKKNKAEAYTFTEGKESHNDHVKNFLDCIRTRNKPACPPETGRVAAMHVHIPNIAARTGESMLLWDEASGRFTNSEAANKLITPEYREPWKLPVF